MLNKIIFEGIEYVEEWKDIKGYEGIYQISSFGNVRAYYKEVIRNELGQSINWKINYNKGFKNRKLYKNKRGYMVISLTKDKISKLFRINRLVAINFIENPNNLPVVDHIKNNEKYNNHIFNLNWTTIIDNTRKDHSGNKHTYFGRRGSEANNSKPIIQYNINGIKLNEFDSAANASRFLGDIKKQKNINSNLRGRSKTAFGFIWKYKN